MKHLYVISIVNNKGLMVSLSIVASTMASAVAEAQKQAETQSDPATFQKLASIDFETD